MEAGQQRRTQTERREESVQRLLDAAEAVFAANGFNGATLNEIGKSTGTDTALLRYYFKDKEGLFDAILKRRSSVVNAMRMEALDDYERAMGDDVTVEGIVRAFVRPAFDLMAADEGWRNYAAIIAYLNSSRGAQRREMSANFDEVSLRLIALMERALPDADTDEIFWAYHFLTGAFTFSLGQTRRIDVLSRGAVSSLDFDALADRFVLTLAAGMRALCTRDMDVPVADVVEERVWLRKGGSGVMEGKRAAGSKGPKPAKADRSSPSASRGSRGEARSKATDA